MAMAPAGEIISGPQNPQKNQHQLPKREATLSFFLNISNQYTTLEAGGKEQTEMITPCSKMRKKKTTKENRINARN